MLFFRRGGLFEPEYKRQSNQYQRDRRRHDAQVRPVLHDIVVIGSKDAEGLL